MMNRVNITKSSNEGNTSAADLLNQARAAGVAVVAADGGLKLRGEAGAVAQWTPVLRPHKAALLALLSVPTPPPSDEWRPLRDAYYQHHSACPTCIAAGKGYGLRCGTGAALWASYSSTPAPSPAPATAPVNPKNPPPRRTK